MDAEFSKDDLRFRDEVRAFIADALDADMRREARMSKNGHVSRELQLEWLRRISRKGWAAPDWPREHGGAEWTAMQNYIFNMETGLAGAPRSTNMGLKMCGPVLLAFGSAAQKQRHLPSILSIDTWWCQGYSEPGAGSDLASLSMTAERVGDTFVLNGSKIWTSYAHWADWMFCLVRTGQEERRQRGISFLLVDMRTPGITVTPIQTIDDPPPHEQEVNQVFFDNVAVPVDNLVGREGEGWSCAKYLLEFERGHFYSATLRSILSRIEEVGRAEGLAGSELAAFRHRLSELQQQAERLAIGEQRAYLGKVEGSSLGAAASMLKLESSVAIQAATELALEVAGPYAQELVRDTFALEAQQGSAGPDYAAPAAPFYFNQRKITILAGSSEIQRNIIAKSCLGL